MSTLWFDLDKFDSNEDFSLWKEKLIVVLIHQNLDGALIGETKLGEKKKSEETSEDTKVMMKKARYAIVMHLSNNVLRQVIGEESPAGMWSKLEQLYMTKTTSNKIYLKGKFYRFTMDSTKTLNQNLDDFNKIVLDLSNIGEKVDEEDQAIILLYSLPDQFRELKTVIQYGKETLSLEDVLSILKTKEFELNVEKGKKEKDESLFMRGRQPRRSFSKGKDNSNRRSPARSKSRGKETRRCHHCGKIGHLRRFCWDLEKKRKDNQHTDDM